MSSILKALRKVEDENAALGGGSVDLAHDILKRSYDEKKNAPWLLISGCVVLMAIAVALGWWLAGYQQKATPSSVSSEMVETSATQPSPVAREDQVSFHEPVEPGIPAAPIASVTVKPEVYIDLPKQEVSQTEPVTEKNQAVILPVMLIEEIVYQQDPAARLAVINGLPVMEGTDIDGVRVIEILADRVRCSYQGEEFFKFKAE